jgi:hypothetical protein
MVMPLASVVAERCTLPLTLPSVGAGVFVGNGVAVGMTGVALGMTVAVGGIMVTVGTRVAVGGTAVSVGMNVAVGGTPVGGTVVGGMKVAVGVFATTRFAGVYESDVSLPSPLITVMLHDTCAVPSARAIKFAVKTDPCVVMDGFAPLCDVAYVNVPSGRNPALTVTGEGPKSAPAVIVCPVTMPVGATAQAASSARTPPPGWRFGRSRMKSTEIALPGK